MTNGMYDFIAKWLMLVSAGLIGISLFTGNPWILVPVGILVFGLALLLTHIGGNKKS